MKLSSVWGQTASFAFPRLLFSSIPFSSVIFGPFAGTFSTARVEKVKVWCQGQFISSPKMLNSPLRESWLAGVGTSEKFSLRPRVSRGPAPGRSLPYLAGHLRLSSLSDHLLTMRPTPNWKEVWVCFESNFLRPEPTDSF